MPLLAVALISAGALAYEILLARLFAIIQWYHFAYMIISIALLGYGASGTFLALAQERLRPRATRRVRACSRRCSASPRSPASRWRSGCRSTRWRSSGTRASCSICSPSTRS